MGTPTELARDAQRGVEGLQAELNYLRQSLEKLQLDDLRILVKLLEQKLSATEKELASLRAIPVIEDRLAKLEKHKEETEKRQWQFIYIFAGAMASLLITVLVQGLIAFIKDRAAR